MDPQSPQRIGMATTVSHIRVHMVCSDDGSDASWDWTVSVADLGRRERDMRTLAASDPECVWTGSRLHNEYHDRATHRNQEVDVTTVTVTLDLSRGVRDMGLVWSQQLSQVLGEYYRTGVLHVGDDIGLLSFLLAMEYFAILYRPEQLVFDSRQAYQQAQRWSDYLAQRIAMAEWVARQILPATRGMDLFFTTCPHVRHHGQRLAVLAHEPDCLLDANLVWTLFNAPKTGTEMQQDFCQYLETRMPLIQAQFVDQPAILHVRVLNVPSSHRVELTDGGEEKKVEDLGESHSNQQHLLQRDLGTVSLAGTGTSVSTTNAALGEPRREPVAPRRNTDDAGESNPKGPSQRKALKGRPWRRKVDGRSNSEGTHRNRDSPPAPVAIVRARSSEISVHSALTLPHVLEGSVLRRTFKNSQEWKAEALRQEWIQSSVLNRGLSTRIRSLLNKSESGDSPHTQSQPNGCGADEEDGDSLERTSQDHSRSDQLRGDINWDWLVSLCIHPDFLLRNSGLSEGKKVLDEVVGSVDRMFDTSAATACTSTTRDGIHGDNTISLVNGAVKKEADRPRVTGAETGGDIWQIASVRHAKTFFHRQPANIQALDDSESCSYDGGLNRYSQLNLLPHVVADKEGGLRNKHSCKQSTSVGHSVKMIRHSIRPEQSSPRKQPSEMIAKPSRTLITDAPAKSSKLLSSPGSKRTIRSKGETIWRRIFRRKKQYYV